MQNLWYMDKFSHKKHALLLSLPPRGAWIEIENWTTKHLQNCGRSPRGERGLKSTTCKRHREGIQCRSPRGERGLKYRSSS